MNFSTADLCDAYETEVRVAEPIFRDYGGVRRFAGPIATVRCHEDNSLVRAALGEKGEGRVLIVDGGGSLRCALLGERLATLALENGWTGIVLNGCLRDSAAIGRMALGVKALNTSPRRSVKRGAGEREVPISFAGVSFRPGEYLYADEDGIVLSARPLALTPGAGR